MPYTWDGKTYCNTDTGVCLTRSEIVEYAELVNMSVSEFVNAYAEIVTSGMITIEEWYALMQQEIIDENIRQYILGRGGIGSMEDTDWAIIGNASIAQFAFLSGFASEISALELSEAQIAARSRMYIGSANAMFNRGYAISIGMPDGLLPQYPGDGNTICLTNCRCVWFIQEVFEEDEEGNEILAGWNCTWIIDPMAENCPDCQENAAEWNPLFVPNPNL